MVVVLNFYVGFNKTNPLFISHFPDYVDPTKDRHRNNKIRSIIKKRKRREGFCLHGQPETHLSCTY